MVETETSLALSNLIRLQEIISKTSHLRDRIEISPSKIEELDRRLEAETTKVEKAQEAIHDSGQERRRLESEVESLRAKLSHYKDQLMEVKTNTAYQAMLHEIGYVEQQIVAKEDQILEHMMESEELENKLAEAHQELEDTKRSIGKEKRELQLFLEQAEKDLQSLAEERTLLEQQLPEPYLARYRRIAAARGGMALAMVSGQSCEACHVRLRPQLLAEVRANREIILCENCSRILYYSAPA